MTDPATYSIRITASAERDMKSLPSGTFHRISEAILSLGPTPRPRACKQLRGREGYRIRVGDYRILYLVDDASRIIEVIAVGHRKDVYR